MPLREREGESMRKVKDSSNQAEYWLIEENSGHAAHSYVTASCFDGNDAIITARMRRQDDFLCSYVRTDLRTGEEKTIFEGGRWPGYLVWNHKLYQFLENRLLETDISTGKTAELFRGEYKLDEIPSITKDGRFLSLSWRNEDRSTSACLLEKETGKCEEIIRKKFPAPYDWINHCMVNPTDPGTYFFCHEGDCCYVTNRMWIADTKEKKAEVFFRQKMDRDMGNGECCGHEMWSPDGKGMYFIKYISSTILPKGVWYIDLATREAKCIADGYPYWHVGVSPDGIHLAADTQEPGQNYSDIILINRLQKTETRLLRVPITGVHPCHPHPVFSPDGSKICFTMLNEAGNLAVGILEWKKMVKWEDGEDARKWPGKKTMDLIEKVADRMVFGHDTDWGMDLNRFDWVPGVGLYGIWKAFEVTKREDYFQYLTDWANRHGNQVYEKPTINSTAPCLMLLELYQKTGKAEYKKICQDMAEYILHDAKRTADGALEHTVTEPVPELEEQMWADTLFMAGIFMARAGRILRKKEYTDLAVEQLIIHYRYLFDEKSGLFFHAWNGRTKDSMGGVHWGRANAWILYSTVEILREAEPFPEKEYICRVMEQHIRTLGKWQQEDGMFLTVLDVPGSYEEISASCGIACGIRRAVTYGYANPAYRAIADKTLEHLDGYVAGDGTVLQVSTGTPVFPDVKTYQQIAIAPTLYGQGLMILALAEAAGGGRKD